MTDVSVQKNENESMKPENAVPPAAKEGKAEPKTKEKKQEKYEPQMYVGPTVPGIGIQNRVYTKMPKEAQERAEKVPEIRLLFIPVKAYPRAIQMLRERTGYLYEAYCRVSELRTGGAEA